MYKRGFVYRLRNARGELLYVGMTIGHAPLRRMAEHRRTQPWWDEVASLEFDTIAPRPGERIDLRDLRRATLAEEARQIRELKPRYNIEHGSRPERRAMEWYPVVGYPGVFLVTYAAAQPC